MTFGEDADLTSGWSTAYIRGFQGAAARPGIGRHDDQALPRRRARRRMARTRTSRTAASRSTRAAQFEYHLEPFRAAIAAGTSQMMPYYGMPVGTEWEEVGFAFNKRRDHRRCCANELGFDGIVCTDWGLISDSVIMGQPMPARAWGVEHLSELERVVKILDAGCDQFGGESRPELVVAARPLRAGQRGSGSTQSVRRLLREKFVLGLFDQPYLDVEHAVATIGRADFVAEGEAAQRAAIVRLTAADSGPAALPLARGQAVYVENIAPAAAARLGRVVDDPADAEVAVLRLNAPYEPRPGGFEAFFHAGSLEFPQAERERIVRICRQVPTIVVLFLDRPAVVPEIAEAAAALLVEFGARDDAVVDVLLGARPRARPTAVRPPVVDERRRGQSQRRPVRHRGSRCFDLATASSVAEWPQVSER